MAKIVNDIWNGLPHEVLVLTPQEATDLIGLLTAQMAGVPLIGNQSGGVPTIVIRNEHEVATKVISVSYHKDPYWTPRK
jgi:hypothetical protein